MIRAMLQNLSTLTGWKNVDAAVSIRLLVKDIGF